jgi:hypothetical protein
VEGPEAMRGFFCEGRSPPALKSGVSFYNL